MKIKMLRPLGVRDFALLWTGMTVSSLGDGIYTVALAWQVYDLSNAPTALSIVAVALHLWHIWILVALYGVGNSVFYPAYTALVPQVLPQEQLVQAAALRQFVRPLSTRVIGPALGGAIVAALGPGTGFLIDPGSFGASTAALLLMAARPLERAAARTVSSVAQQIREGLRFVLALRWLWMSLLAVTLAMVFFLGPVFVLMPFVVRNHLHGGADGLGLVLAAGGVGALVASIVMGQRGAPRRPLAVVYVAWAIAAFALIGYAQADAVWQAALV